MRGGEYSMDAPDAWTSTEGQPCNKRDCAGIAVAGRRQCERCMRSSRASKREERVRTGKGADPYHQAVKAGNSGHLDAMPRPLRPPGVA